MSMRPSARMAVRICSTYSAQCRQPRRWRSNLARSERLSVPSRYSVTSSTASWQSISLRPSRTVTSLPSLDLPFEMGTHARAAPVQEHPLIALGDSEHLADLCAREPVEVAQRDHLALT